MKDFKYMFDIAEAKTKLFDKETQPLSWGYQQGVFETLKEIKEWLIKHDAETKTPLEDEIERLKTECNNLTKMYEVIAITKKDDTQKKLQQERQKVIAELEEWIKSPYQIDDIYCLNREYVIQTSDLVKKLNQIKGE